MSRSLSEVLEVVRYRRRRLGPREELGMLDMQKIRLGKWTLLWNEHRGRKGIGIIPRKAF